MTYVDSLQQINIVIYILKIFCISLGTYYAVAKNSSEKQNVIINLICIIINSIICGIIKNISNSMNSVLCLAILLSLTFSRFCKNNIGYNILITIMSLCINYVLFIFSSAISYFPNLIFNIQNNYIGFISIIVIYFPIVILFFKIKRFKKGFTFLKEKLINDYFDVLILNISVIMLFLFIIFSDYNIIMTERIFLGIVTFSVVMFITIRKCIQLYYKQKLLIQDLNETKEELAKKKEEVEKLEKENLSFSKTSHSIAHKQKSLEYKLNQLMLNR